MAASKRLFVKGIFTFNKKPSMPEFVICSGVINLEELTKFFNENAEYHKEYNGQTQLPIQFLAKDGGLSIVVDTYKKEGSDVSFP